MSSFTSKDDDEIVSVGFDFAALLDAGETISAAAFAVRDVARQDPATGMLPGSETISGSIVTHKLAAGTAGVTYRISCTIDTSAGLRYIESADILVSERE